MAFCAAMEPHLAEAFYIHYMYLSDEAARRSREVYGRNLDRLAGLKATYDPIGMFRHGHTAKVPAPRARRLIDQGGEPRRT